ncbi:MAG: 16S rRNA (uracil(1498)-N(3))-methyltransferase [Planctomycetes bacterium]|nr:16S rRNA (uracil(1498)-N(3))-methyltransferase [Planctomycetota bacterium]
MPRTNRFYLATRPTANKVFLDQKQSHHLKTVLRLKKGDRIELFDQMGNSYQGIIDSPENGRAGIKITSTVKATENAVEITLATAIPKGKRMDWLIQKAEELGLKKIIPLKTKRSAINPSATKIKRWQKIAVESAKQSGQNSVLEITEITQLPDLLRSAKNYNLALIAYPESKNYLPAVLAKHKQVKKILYLIGPEGDFTPEEVKQAIESGFRSVLLPVSSVLRVETAGLTMLAMLLYAYGVERHVL